MAPGVELGTAPNVLVEGATASEVVGTVEVVFEMPDQLLESSWVQSTK